MNLSATHRRVRWAAPALLLAIALLLSGCDGLADLGVENQNAPNRSEALANPEDVVSLLAGGYKTLYDGIYGGAAGGATFYAPGPHLDGFGDSQTMTNAFASLWTPSKEPKVRLQNTISSNIPGNITEPAWGTLNSALSSANDVIIQIESEGLQIRVDGSNQTQKTLAAAYFLRGWAHGRLANIFDKAYVLTQETDLANLQFQPYQQVASQAATDLQRASEIAGNNSFTLSGTFLPWESSVSSSQFAKIANTVAARVLVSNSRTASENADLSSVEGYSWGDVLTLTQNGLQQETVSITLDGIDWLDSYQGLSVIVKWYYRVDNRLINLMDSSYPIKYPPGESQNGNVLPKAESPDQRLCDVTTTGSGALGPGVEQKRDGCYFLYVTDLSFFTISRGPKLYSNYWWGRDFALQQAQGTAYAGPRPFFLPVENNTIMAEAMIRANGDVAGARQAINNGTRVENGELEPLSGNAGQSEVLNAIFYERDLELYRMVHGQSYFDLRRRSALQAGTPAHLPVPASELQTVQAEVYTFGGTSFTSEAGTATGDQAWCTPVDGDMTTTGNVAPNGCDGPFRVPEGNAPDAQTTSSGAQPPRAIFQ